MSTLRLTLDADLTIAAAAAEADRMDVAADVVDFERQELAAFLARAERTLDAATAPLDSDTTNVMPVAEPRATGRSVGPLRRRLAVASPALLAAAVVVGVLTNSVGGVHRAPAVVAKSDLVASYSQLTDLARAGNDPTRLIAVGDRLNQSVAALIAAAAHDPTKLRQALRILEAEQIVLGEHRPSGAARLLAQARALIRALQARLPQSTLAVRRAPSGSAGPAAPTNVLTVVVPTPSAAPEPTAQATDAPPPSPAAADPSSDPGVSSTPPPDAGSSSMNPQPSPDSSFGGEPWPFGDYKLQTW